MQGEKYLLRKNAKSKKQIIRRSHFLREFDEILSSTLTELMQESGLKIVNNTEIDALEESAGAIAIKTRNGATLDGFSDVIWACHVPMFLASYFPTPLSY